MADLLSESVSRMNEQFLACMEKDSDAFSAKLRNCSRDELYLITPEYLTPYLSYIKNNKRLFRTATENAEVLGMDKSYNKLHSEVVLPDDDSLKPALYQGLIEGLYCVNSFGSIQTNWKAILYLSPQKYRFFLILHTGIYHSKINGSIIIIIPNRANEIPPIFVTFK